MIKKDNKTIDFLLTSNDEKFQLLKAAEEFSELTTALLQYVNKGGRITTKKHVIEEIGDCYIRLKILESVFDKKLIKKRINYKLSKFDEYIKDGKLVGSI